MKYKHCKIFGVFPICLGPIDSHRKEIFSSNCSKHKGTNKRTRIGQSQKTTRYFLLLLTFSFSCLYFVLFLFSIPQIFLFHWYQMPIRIAFHFRFFWLRLIGKNFFCKVEEIIWNGQFILRLPRQTNQAYTLFFSSRVKNLCFAI